MKDVERLLEDRDLAPPSAELDGRMAELFAEAQTTPRARVFARSTPLWLAAGLCVVFAFVGYWFHGMESTPMPQPGTPMTIYIIHTDGQALRGALDLTADDHVFLGGPNKPRVQVFDLKHRTQENGGNRDITNGGVS